MKALPTVYSIKGPWKGQLAIVTRPRGGDGLEDELRGWEDGGLDVIVSLLPASEAGELGLAEEATLAKTHGLQFVHFPIQDFSVPPSREATLSLIEKLDEALTSGQNVGIHCREGIGRSATIASSLLVLRGIEPEEALNRVATARGRAVPDTREQREWIINFARYLAAATIQP